MATLIFKSQKLQRIVTLTQEAKYFTASFTEQIEAYEKEIGKKYDFDKQPDLTKYGKHQNPTIWLVKDEGIYLMAAGAEYRIPKDKSHICYAEGYEPHVPGSWDKCRAAVGGDDFCDTLPFGKDLQEGVLLGADIHIKVTPTAFTIKLVYAK